MSAGRSRRGRGDGRSLALTVVLGAGYGCFLVTGLLHALLLLAMGVLAVVTLAVSVPGRPR